MKSDLYFVKGNIYKCTRILVDEKNNEWKKERNIKIK